MLIMKPCLPWFALVLIGVWTLFCDPGQVSLTLHTAPAQATWGEEVAGISESQSPVAQIFQSAFSSKWTFFFLFASALLAFHSDKRRLGIVIGASALLLAVVRNPVLLLAGIAFVTGFAILKGLQSPKERAKRAKRRPRDRRYIEALEAQVEDLREEVEELREEQEAPGEER